MYYVYIIKSKKDNKHYTGSTNDLRKRFNEHNSGKIPSTKNRGPFKLIYYEASLNEYDATQRERYLKSGMGKRYLNNRLKRFLSLTGFTPLELSVKQGKVKKALTGFTLVELLMTIIIAAVILVPVSFVIIESLTNTFLPEYYTVATSLLKGEIDRITNLRFTEVTNDSNSFSGDFSNYSYQVSFYYVNPFDLDTQSLNPTDYKRVEVAISRTGFPTVETVTLVTDN